MKTYYKIQCEIEVEAANDDIALSILRDACDLYPGIKLVRWIDTTLNEKEQNNEHN